MGVSVQESSSSGKRSLSADVNLVPFIDLLSVCICFLLMTAVWIELGILEVKQTYGTEAASNAESLELEVSYRSPKSLTFALKRNGKIDKKIPVDATSAEALPAELQSKLAPLLEKAGIPKSAIINTSPGVTHGDVVALMDSLRKNKIVNLGLSVAPLEI